jgi:glyoxylase-like metal-dependent hydrolase (beta-lactamase superfamily II)/rhodanese-related sulfurtransferase
MIFEQFYLECLSHASYLIGDTSTGRAVVVDPQRDVQQYLDSAKSHGLKIELVLETHFHADFLSGHLELAKATGATIGYGSVAKPQFAARSFPDGERYALGEVVLEIRHTPGHTPESVSIVVFEHANDKVPYGVLTGDTMFIGDVGRPDLLVSVGKTSDELGRMLFNSLNNKLLTLPDATRVYPAHGAGSACGKNLSTETMSTIGEQRKTNYALQFTDIEKFVDVVTEGQPPAPGYFIYDAQRNSQDRDVLDEHAVLKKLTISEVAKHIDTGAVVLDTRDPQLFATGHIVGSINVGMDGRYAEYAGAVVSPGTNIVIATDEGHEREARIRLARIGYDNVVGWFSVDELATSPEYSEKSSRLTADEFSQRAGTLTGLQVVDVRKESEFKLGSVQGATNIPVVQLPNRISELNPALPTVVYCAGGYRSSIASSLLKRAGFADVSDVLGGFESIRLVRQ